VLVRAAERQARRAREWWLVTAFQQASGNPAGCVRAALWRAALWRPALSADAASTDPIRSVRSGRNMPAGGCLIRLGRTAQPPAAVSRSAPGTACRKMQRSQHPPPQGDHAALAAGNRSSGRPASHAIGGSSRRGALHGLDGVEDTRACHDPPSPGQFCTRERCHRGIHTRCTVRRRPAPGRQRKEETSSQKYRAASPGPDTTAPRFEGRCAAP
jgi:hypothetical protein